VLYLYGAKENGTHTAPSNEAFDANLRHRNPEWGVRGFEAVAELWHRPEAHLATVAVDTGLWWLAVAPCTRNDFKGTKQTKAELPASWGKLTFLRSRLKVQLDPQQTFNCLSSVSLK
jgi:hypothetical protein